MNFKRKTFNSTAAIFLIIAVIYAIGNYIWWTINTPIIPINISAVHFIDILKNTFLSGNAPLLTWIMKGIFFIVGKEHYDLIVIFVNYIFFLIPLYFIYKIGVELKDKETGNIAMILFALVPAVYGMSRQYGHKDYHIIAGITFNIYCLIKADYFRDKKWSIWYGISVGLGLMIKDAFIAYFFVPFVYIFISGLRKKIDKTKIINVLIAIAIGSLIAGWHYFRYGIVRKILYEPVTEPAPILVFESLRVMTIGLCDQLLSPPIFIIFVIGLIYFILKYKGKYKYVILLWFFVPWFIIMSMGHHKLSEYGAGFIPAMILMGAVFISQIQKKYVKKIILILLIVIGCLQYVDFSYNIFNVGLFKLKLTYGKYYMRYYGGKNYYIKYDYKTTKSILQLVKYLKYKYQNEKIHFVLNKILDAVTVENQIYFNEMQWGKTIYDITVFIFVNNNFVLEYEKIEIFKELIKIGFNNISDFIDKYYKIDELYLENKNNRIKITIFGRKDKFPEYKKNNFLEKYEF